MSKCNLKRRYGITKSDVHALLARQDNKCAICAKAFEKKPRAYHVDHCHKTGRVRGVLCGNCNRGIGYLADDDNRLLAAATYLLASRVEKAPERLE